jgi:hypothetical protein
MQVPWVASRNTLSMAPVTPAQLGQWTMVARKTLVGSSRATPFLPPVVATAGGGGRWLAGAAQTTPPFPSVAAEAQPRHGELSSEMGIV